MSRNREVDEYLERNKVSEILTSMLEDIVVKRPADVVPHMIEYLRRYDEGLLSIPPSAHGGHSPHMSDAAVAVAGSNPNLGFGTIGGDSEDLPLAGDDGYPSHEARGRPRRGGISAEPFDPEKLNDEPFPFYPKSAEEKMRIQNSLTGNILFAHLEPQELSTLFDAMFSKIFDDGQDIITQGDEGDFFYIVDSGEAEVFVSSVDENGRLHTPNKVAHVNAGGCFGELALIYGTPRAATVRALGSVRCWCIDRDTYRRILLSQTIAKRNLYESFLERVPILQPLTRYERLAISDALTSANFKKGEQIIKQGEPGDSFYIIVEGEVRVINESIGENGQITEHEVNHLRTSDFFGEIALLTNQPRAASVYALTDVRTVRLDRKAFTRLLGPLSEILRRNMDTYLRYMRM